MSTGKGYYSIALLLYPVSISIPLPIFGVGYLLLVIGDWNWELVYWELGIRN
jgi:hypothetical protein